MFDLTFEYVPRYDSGLAAQVISFDSSVYVYNMLLFLLFLSHSFVAACVLSIAAAATIAVVITTHSPP